MTEPRDLAEEQPIAVNAAAPAPETSAAETTAANEPVAETTDAGDPAPPAETADAAQEAPAEETVAIGPHHRGIVEALLFAADKPLTGRQLAQIVAELSLRQIRQVIEDLRREYDERGRAFQIEEIAEGYRMMTRPEFRDWVTSLQRHKRDAKLSEAAIETLAIVAYKQPLTRARIEDIRGVQSDQLLRTLLEKKLIRITGRDDVPGRPLLYGTTKDFLDHFGLKSLKDLPTSRDLPPVK